MKGIPELLEFFKGNGTICCVASSTVTPMVEKYLNIAGIRDYFKHIIGGDQVKNSKPNPEIFLKALGKTPFNKDEAVIFEDSENGIRAAHAAGIPVICIPDLKYPNDSLKELPIHIVDSALDVIDLYSE
jgi:beta-phosphoglucomutase-like phosphatase (HAD superfamily)